jgi:hypothetical protein
MEPDSPIASTNNNNNNKIVPEAPQTPKMRNDSFDVNGDDAADGTGRKTRGSITSDSSEEAPDSVISSPTLPYLAHVRRRSSFISPFQINRARYLLSFADADTAHEWWLLMQSEYPDTLRESPNLFSFKSDRIHQAWDNGRFAHLKEKWSYRQTDGKEDKILPQQQALSQRRVSTARMPLMPTLSEGSVMAGFASPSLERLEDPFTPEKASKMEFAQLNMTSNHIQKSVSQSTIQLDALLEGQQASAKGFQKLSSTIERMTLQMETLARRQQDHEIVLRELTAAATANNAASDVQYRHQQAAALHSLQSVIEETCSRVQELYLKPPPTPGPNHEILHDLQDEMTQMSTLLRDLYNRPLPEVPTPHAEDFGKLQHQLLQNTVAIQKLTERRSEEDKEAAAAAAVSSSNLQTLQTLQKELSQATEILREITEHTATAATSTARSTTDKVLQSLQAETAKNTTTLLNTLTTQERKTQTQLSKIQNLIIDSNTSSKDNHDTLLSSTTRNHSTLLSSMAKNHNTLTLQSSQQQQQIQTLHKATNTLLATQSNNPTTIATQSTLQTQEIQQQQQQQQQQHQQQQIQNLTSKIDHLKTTLSTHLAAQLSTQLSTHQETFTQQLKTQQQQQQQILKSQLTEISRVMVRREGMAGEEYGYGGIATRAQQVLPPPRKVGRKIVGYVYEKF